MNETHSETLALARLVRWLNSCDLSLAVSGGRAIVTGPKDFPPDALARRQASADALSATLVEALSLVGGSLAVMERKLQTHWHDSHKPPAAFIARLRREVHYCDPATFSELAEDERRRLVAWLTETFEADPDRARRFPTTYEMKHRWEKVSGGFYTTDGQFVGAVLEAGLPLMKGEPVGTWTMRVRQKPPCPILLHKRREEIPCWHPADPLTGRCRYHRAGGAI